MTRITKEIHHAFTYSPCAAHLRLIPRRSISAGIATTYSTSTTNDHATSATDRAHASSLATGSSSDATCNNDPFPSADCAADNGQADPVGAQLPPSFCQAPNRP